MHKRQEHVREAVEQPQTPGRFKPRLGCQWCTSTLQLQYESLPKALVKVFVCLFASWKGKSQLRAPLQGEAAVPVSPGSEDIQLSSMSSAPTPHACKTHNEAGRRPPNQRKRSLMLRPKARENVTVPGTSSPRSRPHFHREEKLKATGKTLSPPHEGGTSSFLTTRVYIKMSHRCMNVCSDVKNTKK